MILDFYDLAGGRPLFPDLGNAFAPQVGFQKLNGYLSCGRVGEVQRKTTVSDTLCSRIPLGGQVVPNNDPTSRGIMHFDGLYYPGGGTQAYGRLVGIVEKPRASSPDPLPTLVVKRSAGLSVPALDQHKGSSKHRHLHTPHQLVPYAQDAPDFRLGNTRHSRLPGFANTNPNVGNQVRPGRGNVGRGRVAGPPKPRTKEKKGRIPAWFAEIAKRAWDVTEANDLADNLFECLPDAIQKKAPKTGRTHKGSWAGEGHRYTSIVDKARTVHRNLELLDLDCAFRKVSCNHITDMLWGRFFGTVDAGFQRGRVSGYSFATRGSGADVTKESYDRFMQWIEANPALDRLLKSLDCENLGK